MSTETQRKISVGFDDETMGTIVQVAKDLEQPLNETIRQLTVMGLDAIENNFGAAGQATNERLLTLISDIFDLARTVPGSLPPDDLDLLDQNISERIAAELNFEGEIPDAY